MMIMMMMVMMVIIIIRRRRRRRILNNISGKHEIKELQLTAMLITARILWKVQNVKVQNPFHGRNNITCTANCKYRTATTVYTVETGFVSGT